MIEQIRHLWTDSMMEAKSSKLDAMNVNQRIGRRVRELREAQGWSLEALAERSGVSRSNISLIERGQSSPTATVLDKLSAGLGVTLASLFEDARAREAEPSPLARVAGQPLWTDPASGYVRRNVSPPLRSPLQLVDVVFPPGQRVAYDSGARDAEIHQQVWMIEGAMEVTVGADALAPGGRRLPRDAAGPAHRLSQPHGAAVALPGRAGHAAVRVEPEAFS